MRELKFRAWVNVPNANTMLENIDLKELWESGRTDEDYGTSRFEAETISGIQWTFKDLIFMQYTGLNDKNGKEIYEGDIVKIAIITDIFYEVKWDKFEDSDGYLSGETWMIALETLYMNCDDCEVIGNIYEHPHLLETKA